MAQKWGLCRIIKGDHVAGGPEKYVELLEKASKDAGKWRWHLGIVLRQIGASLLTAATIKVVDYFKSKKKNNADEIEMAKEEIVKGIKEYDATTHPEEAESN